MKFCILHCILYNFLQISNFVCSFHLADSFGSLNQDLPNDYTSGIQTCFGIFYNLSKPLEPSLPSV